MPNSFLKKSIILNIILNVYNNYNNSYYFISLIGAHFLLGYLLNIYIMIADICLIIIFYYPTTS